MMALKPLKSAVVGLGNMGRHHVRINTELDEIELVAICDTNADTLAQFSAQYHVKSYADIEALLQAEKLDFITIASSTKSHYTLAKKCIQAGCHVLIEKPIAQSLAEAEELINLAQKKQVFIMVGHIERYNPAVQTLIKLVTDGRLGAVKTLVSRRLGPFPNQIKDADVIIDLAVHDLDICTAVLNETPISITGQSGSAIIDDRPDYANILMTFKQACAFSQVSWISPVRIRELLVTGTNGYARLDFMNQTIELFPSDYSAQKNADQLWDVRFNLTEKIDIPVEKKEPLKEEVRHFVQAITTGVAPLTNGETGLKALSLALRAKSV